jgi:ribosomal protein L12E/L44/L45/RPP1/RPP2
MRTQLQEVFDRLRGLNPDEIRSRLLEIEVEEKALRVLLRTAKAAQSAAPAQVREESRR